MERHEDDGQIWIGGAYIAEIKARAEKEHRTMRAVAEMALDKAWEGQKWRQDTGSR